jgi:hypothetical protein
MADVASAGHRAARVEIEADAMARGGAVRRLVSTGARSNPGSWESPATILMDRCCDREPFMPEISRFPGIVIRMSTTIPPHFHAK